MANQNKPNGFVPVGTIVGASPNFQEFKFATAATDAVRIGIGDLVTLSGGCDDYGFPIVKRAAADDALAGVCTAVEVDGSKLQTTYREASIARYIYVNIDPNTIYSAQVDEALALTSGSFNAHLAAADCSTVTGVSAMQVDATGVATTATFELALLGFDPDTTPNSLYNRVLCKINKSCFDTVRLGVAG